MNRLSHANHVALTACILLMLATGLHAQTATPYTGEVTGDGVFVRSGPNARSYAITQVDSGQKVRVVDERAGWLGIEPIAGCYSVISARYVTPDAPGKIGTVTGQNVHVFAAGMSQLENKSFSSPQGRLDRGQRVRIIGRVYGEDRQIEYFVIKPPTGAKYWISGQYVRPAAPESPAESEATMTPVERPTADTTDTTEPTDTETETVAPTPPPSEPGLSLREEVELRRQLQAIETQLNAEIKKPVGERDLDAVLAKAKKIDVPADSRFRSQHDALVSYLNKEIAQVQKYREAQRLVQAVLAGEELPPAADADPTREPRRGYDLTGMLQESRLPPTITGGRRFVIRDPGTDIVRGYATSSDAVDLTAYTGQVVGLRGRIAYDRAIAYDVLKATEIDVIDPRGAATATRPPAETTSVPPPTPIATATDDAETSPPTAPTDPIELSDPAVADLLEPVELPAPQDTEARSQPTEPTPLEAQLPPIEPAAPATQPEPADLATATPPTEAETAEPAMQPVTAPPATEPDIPAPTAPEPPRPDIAVAPAQPDITPPSEPAAPAAPAPAETAAVESPEPVAPTTPEEPAATPEPIAVPTTPEPQQTPTEPVATTPEPEATMPEPVTPDMPQPVTPEPPAVATPAEPQETTPEPVAIPTTPEPEPTPTEPVATTPEPEATMPEPVTPEMPQPVAPEPPAIATPAEPRETTPEPTEPEPVTVEPAAPPATPEPVAVTPEPAAAETPEAPAEPEDTTPEPVAVDAQPETPATVDLDPGTPEADDEDDQENLAGIRPVAVAPIDMSRQDPVEVAIAERDDQTDQTGEQDDADDEGDAATTPRTTPPAFMPAPQHSSPMPTEILVTPDGYEVEYD